MKLICLPPSILYFPAAGLQAIHSFLEVNGCASKVLYLNKKLEKECFFRNNPNEFVTLLPYIYLYNKYICNDTEKANSTKYIIKNKYADLFYLDQSLSDELFNDYIDELYRFLYGYFNDLLAEDNILIGFTSKFYQWIPASICAYIIKQINPETKLLIGGWTNKDAAKSILNVNSYFDYAIWGEGEIPVYKLYESLISGNSIDEVPRLIYRDKKVVRSAIAKSYQTYVDLNVSAYYALDDYLVDTDIKRCVVPLERSRGCNWNKCRFCYLSHGYKYRIKTNEKLINEIKYYINKYQIFKFVIVDNDFVGNDIDTFKLLLQELVKIKVQYPLFTIVMAEVITHNLDKEIIGLMKNSGILNSQIGLESISQSLLNKINKKQTVAENLFFIKESLNVGMSVRGANIITCIPDENDSDILESVDNIYYLRFFLWQADFELHVVNLTVSNYSNYLKCIVNEQQDKMYSSSSYAYALSESAYSKADRFSLFEFEKK